MSRKTPAPKCRDGRGRIVTCPSVQGFAHGWDFSYNIFVEESGSGLRSCNGAGRDDYFEADPAAPGTYRSNGFFKQYTKDANNRASQVLGDNKTIVYCPFDGSAMAGKIESMSDRNGNTMTFQYDGEGKLIQINDTLGRPITISYDPRGRLVAVTDFTGREVKYGYNNRDQLISATTPAVINTPHGNDFPNGKTTTYTYSNGFNDRNLNNNLLTITDGRRNDPTDPTFGQGPYLVNVYSPIRDPKHLEYDRVVRQNIGGGIIDLYYEEVIPGPNNNNASLLVIQNDQVGNVSERYFDAAGNLVRLMEFTGRGNASNRTTRTQNRPVNKLRPTDPDFFLTRHEFNGDYKKTRTIHPNGNITEWIYESDLNPLAAPRIRGNLREIRRLPGTHVPVGDQPVLVEKFEYDNNYGCGSCGNNHITKYTDARGNTIHSSYDIAGNLIARTNKIASIVETWEYNSRGQLIKYMHPDNGSGHRREDIFTYYQSGPQKGYLQSSVVDSGGFENTTVNVYDELGRLIRKVDPRNYDKLYWYNQLDQVVQTKSPETQHGTDVRYCVQTWYDANNNVARYETENRDASGEVVSGNPWFTVRQDYDSLNSILRTEREVDASRIVAEEYIYDLKRNRLQLRHGESVNGNQEKNTLNKVYDERGLVFLDIKALGHVNQSTTQYDYGPNRNLIAETHGVELEGRVTLHEWDSYNRLLATTDPMGNVEYWGYDANGNGMLYRHEGELLDLPGSARNVLLQENKYAFDPLDRLVEETQSHFTNNLDGSIVSVGDGFAKTVTVWSDNSQVLATTNDKGHVTAYVYDSANRLSQVIDAKGNIVYRTLDRGDNQISLMEVERSDLGGSDQVFVYSEVFDGLNRSIKNLDNIGGITERAYDSRNNLIIETGPLGNTVSYVYDGLNRVLRSVRCMTDTGNGNGVKIGEIVTGQFWDDSGRLSSQADDSGNHTRYEYDEANRMTAIEYADGTRRESSWDAYNTKVATLDPKGVTTRSKYDLNGRHIQIDIIGGGGTGPGYTSFEKYQYDGLSRMKLGEDDDSLVERNFDSISNLIEDRQNGHGVKALFDGVGNLIEKQYPDGTLLTYQYDANNNLVSISDSVETFVELFYVGNRVEQRWNSNGMITDVEYNGVSAASNQPYDFGVKRISRKIHRISGGGTLSDTRFKWDGRGNRTAILDSRNGTVSMLYDSASRLISSSLSGTNTIYSLDDLGNRATVEVTGKSPITYSQSTSSNRALSQYSDIEGSDISYDLNGNTVMHDGLTFHYDYKDRLVSVPGKIANEYDVLGRRLSRTGVGVTKFVHYRDSCLVDSPEGSSSRNYVYSRELDDLICVFAANGKLFFHSDSSLSVKLVTGQAGQLISGYSYGDYGRREIAQQSEDLEIGFHGLRHDTIGNYELIHARNRYLNPDLGRFLTRDPGEIWHDPLNLGNAYTFVGNNPYSWSDPFGLKTKKTGCCDGVVTELKPIWVCERYFFTPKNKLPKSWGVGSWKNKHSYICCAGNNKMPCYGIQAGANWEAFTQVGAEVDITGACTKRYVCPIDKIQACTNPVTTKSYIQQSCNSWANSFRTPPSTCPCKSGCSTGE